jgi:phage tail sheath protein FI
VVRVASTDPGDATNMPTNAAVSLGATAFTATAGSEGRWGNNLRIVVSWPAADRFDLTVSEVDPATGAALRQETFLGLTMATVRAVVNQSSQLIVIPATPAVGTVRPQPSGTTSADITASFPLPATAHGKVHESFAGTDADAQNVDLGIAPIASLDEAAGRLQTAIRAANPQKRSWSQATVRVVPGSTSSTSRLQVIPGLAASDAVVTFTDAGGDTTAGDLKLDSGGTSGPAAYIVGSTTTGHDGVPANGLDLIGSEATDPPTGMYALDKVSLFNILCLPRVARLDGSHAFSAAEVVPAISKATAYCDNRRAFLILDTPTDVKNLPQVKTWLSTNASLRDKNVAFYFPRVEIADPLNAFRPRSFGASGTLAGLYARTDAGRGVWKAPAGTEAVLRGIQSLDYTMTDAENGALNPLAINCLRNFPVYGNVCWGARTLDGSDQQASEWKYIPVRRLALFLEESLYRGTQWVVFEPNDEPLWSQIRLNVGAFMHNLFRQGAFQGSSPREAYLVKCDRETTTQNDIDLGIVNIVVGFAPLKPAEFVIIKIQQLAGQIQT